jgi:hypothetical protein
MTAKQWWFRLGRLRHGNVLAASDVAAAIVAAVMLPQGRKYGLVELTPTAPRGELPKTLEDWDKAIYATASRRRR